MNFLHSATSTCPSRPISRLCSAIVPSACFKEIKMLFIKKMNMCSLGGNTNNKEGATLRPESDHRRCLKCLVLVRSFEHL